MVRFTTTSLAVIAALGGMQVEAAPDTRDHYKDDGVAITRGLKGQQTMAAAEPIKPHTLAVWKTNDVLFTTPLATITAAPLELRVEVEGRVAGAVDEAGPEAENQSHFEERTEATSNEKERRGSKKGFKKHFGVYETDTRARCEKAFAEADHSELCTNGLAIGMTPRGCPGSPRTRMPFKGYFQAGETVGAEKRSLGKLASETVIVTYGASTLVTEVMTVVSDGAAAPEMTRAVKKGPGPRFGWTTTSATPALMDHLCEDRE